MERLDRRFTLQDNVVWHDGMLLTAEHFQCLSERMEGVAFYHAENRSPFNWGIRSLILDASQIEQGLFVIEALDAVLPDGTIIQHTSDHPLSLKLMPENTKDGELLISLGINPAQLKGTDKEAFYEHQPEHNPTDAQDADASPVILYKPEPSLHQVREAEPLGNRFIIGRVRLRDGAFTLTQYCPPSLRLDSNSFLWEEIDILLSEVRKKAWHLRKIHNETRPTGLDQKMERRLVLHALTSGLLTSEAILKIENSHPYDLYLSLCSMLGQMDVLRDEALPPILRPYNHHDIYASFKEVTTHIHLILESLSGSRYNIHQFDKDQNTFRLVMQERWLKQPLILAISSENQDRRMEVVRWMMDCLIGNPQQMQQMKRTRTLGAKRTLANHALPNLNRPDLVFFTIEPTQMHTGEELIIANYTSQVPPPDFIQLYMGDERGVR